MICIPVLLLSTAMAAGGDVARPADASAVAWFTCDFTQYPPRGNVEISMSQCDLSIYADFHPHLRLMLAEKSRFTMKFSLPQAPKTAFLDVVHLASSDAEGKGDSPITVSVNGKPVVENWNVGPGGYRKTSWPIGDKLAKGENTIQWQAGKLRTFYWLQKAEVEVMFNTPVQVQFPKLKVDNALFWEGRFDQCSYNAVATVLDHFYGVEGWTDDREVYEKRVFVAALDRHGLGAFFGWAPWTSYMAQAGTIRWNGQLVTDLKAERFALRPKANPTTKDQEMIVRYEPGEEAKLADQLRARLQKGPVIIWTPYAAAMDFGRQPWRHVRRLDGASVAVRFNPHMTHSVVVNLEEGKVKVYDNSWPWGSWVVEPETIVATAAAMAGSVRLKHSQDRSLVGYGLTGKGLEGVANDEYNVVFWRQRAQASASPAAKNR